VTWFLEKAQSISARVDVDAWEPAIEALCSSKHSVHHLSLYGNHLPLALAEFDASSLKKLEMDLTLDQCLEVMDMFLRSVQGARNLMVTILICEDPAVVLHPMTEHVETLVLHCASFTNLFPILLMPNR
jgi:hypothetical protein